LIHRRGERQLALARTLLEIACIPPPRYKWNSKFKTSFMILNLIKDTQAYMSPRQATIVTIFSLDIY
jgi:hypothetical protein